LANLFPVEKDGFHGTNRLIDKAKVYVIISSLNPFLNNGFFIAGLYHLIDIHKFLLPGDLEYLRKPLLYPLETPKIRLQDTGVFHSFRDMIHVMSVPYDKSFWNRKVLFCRIFGKKAFVCKGLYGLVLGKVYHKVL